MIEVTDEQLVKLFALWVSEYNTASGLFDNSVYDQYKDVEYPEFAKEAFKYYIAKVQGETE